MGANAVATESNMQHLVKLGEHMTCDPQIPLLEINSQRAPVPRNKAQVIIAVSLWVCKMAGDLGFNSAGWIGDRGSCIWQKTVKLTGIG